MREGAGKKRRQPERSHLRLLESCSLLFQRERLPAELGALGEGGRRAEELSLLAQLCCLCLEGCLQASQLLHLDNTNTRPGDHGSESDKYTIVEEVSEGAMYGAMQRASQSPHLQITSTLLHKIARKKHKRCSKDNQQHATGNMRL